MSLMTELKETLYVRSVGSKMPLTSKGKEAFKNFKKRYGIRAREVFYSYMKKYPKRTKSWHRL